MSATRRTAMVRDEPGGGGGPLDFIFMLTRQDRTIVDGLEVFDAIRSVGLKHVGFKDVGVEPATLAELDRRIKEAGATSYLEVVSTSPEAALNSARVAADIGVDCLLGGTDAAAMVAIAKSKGVGCFPFPGTPMGHPTRLGGSPREIAQHCRDFVAQGCTGADLLAYRATEADPIELVRAARAGLGSARLIVAGSVNGPERIRALAAAGADAFTIGSAVFDGSFVPHAGGIHAQLRAVLAAID